MGNGGEPFQYVVYPFPELGMRIVWMKMFDLVQDPAIFRNRRGQPIINKHILRREVAIDSHLRSLSRDGDRIDRNVLNSPFIKEPEGRFDNALP